MQTLVPESLLRRLDVPGPRYTSYPTADRFGAAFGPHDYGHTSGSVPGVATSVARRRIRCTCIFRREDAARVLRRGSPGEIPRRARPFADPRRPGAPRCHHGFDVPGRVEFESIELAYLVKMREYFAAEIESLAPLAEAGLVDLSDSAIQVTANGWFFVRGVAMAVDRQLHSDQVTGRFSRII